MEPQMQSQTQQPKNNNLIEDSGNEGNTNDRCNSQLRCLKRALFNQEKNQEQLRQTMNLLVLNLKKTKNKANQVGSDQTGDRDVEPYDFDQESDDSIEIESREKKKAEPLEDAVTEFFEEPVWKDGDPPNLLLNFCCKWCKGWFRAHGTTTGSLKKHWDGSTQAVKNNHGCPNRKKAKFFGAKLPLSVH
ncbi:hypothetical protein PCANC_04392 [Puccinia coronata f. sp. avenae]|uniref:Uncharacterized protein n=1 Tax=Puccinia coronata f. sp. avenae TaxID=200324 RepID=A0A2N5T8Z1_9BASI|nr:hypothetical protein PCANC_04392 [Puccinia coronata f. sp. avenae]